MKKILSWILMISMILGSQAFVTFSEVVGTSSNMEMITEDEELATQSDTEPEDESIASPSDTEPEEESVATLSEFKFDEEITASPISLQPVETIIASPAETEVVFASSSEIYEESDFGLLLPSFKAPRAKKELKNNLFGAPTFPTIKDMRDEENASGYPILPEVRNQGSEGLCWAFSTLGMMEISLRKQGIINTLPDARESDLSEAALGYFVLDGLQNVTEDSSTNIDTPGLEGNDYTERRVTNKGGNQFEATIIGSSYMGMVLEDNNTKYANVDAIFGGNINIDEYAFNKNNYEIKNVQFINYLDKDIIKQAVIDHGSVGINYSANNGTYSVHEWNGKAGEKFYSSSLAIANHSVLIVGWDDTVPKSYFSNSSWTPANDGAWLIRNSWGPSALSTNGGYFWLSYEDRSIDDTLYSIEAMEADTYKYNYHYDTTGQEDYFVGSSTDHNPTHFAIANVFHVTNDFDQTLDAVSVAVSDAGAKFEIRIYTKDTAMSNPTDGILQGTATTTTGTFATAGIYTIPLTSKVMLAKNTYYSIVIKPLTAETKVMIDSSKTIPERKYVNKSALGQSYWGNSSLTSWADYNYGELSTTDDEGENFRIKGLTNSAVSIFFNGNGAMSSMSPQSVVPGETVQIRTNTLTRNGYTFTGWNTEVDGSGDSYDNEDEFTVGTDSITLFAQWAPITYTINYNANGGIVLPASFEKTYGVPYAGALATPTRDGYDFIAWYVNSTFTREFTMYTDLYRASGEPVYIYAKWRGQYAINYYLNGGSFIQGFAPIDSRGLDDEVILPFTSKVTRTGYDFVSWHDAPSLSDESRLTIIAAGIANEKNIYAKWNPKTYNVNLIVGNGTIVSGNITSYKYGVGATLPTNVISIDNTKTFSGWYENSDFIGNVVKNIPATAIGDKTYYAKYSAKPVPISPSGGSNGSSGGGGGGTGGGGGGGGRGGVLPASQATGASGGGPGGTVSSTKISVPMSAVTTNYNTGDSTWYMDEKGNWHLNTVGVNGEIIEEKNGFACITRVVANEQGIITQFKDIYYFDIDGKMYTGWLTDSLGVTYYFETSGSEIGKQVHGWKNIGGVYYYFGQDGNLFKGGVTPDGYIVDAEGKWQK